MSNVYELPSMCNSLDALLNIISHLREIEMSKLPHNLADWKQADFNFVNINNL